jgi:hypothetical protein
VLELVLMHFYQINIIWFGGCTTAGPMEAVLPAEKPGQPGLEIYSDLVGFLADLWSNYFWRIFIKLIIFGLVVAQHSRTD